MNKNKTGVIILLLILILGCNDSHKSSNDSNTDPDSNPDSVDFDNPDAYESNSVDLIDYEIFPEKRRTKFFGPVNPDSTDLDSDGFTGDDDPYPLDSSYPGIIIDSLNFPKATPVNSVSLRNKTNGELSFSVLQYKTPSINGSSIQMIEPEPDDSGESYEYDESETDHIVFNIDPYSDITINYHIPKDILEPLDPENAKIFKYYLDGVISTWGGYETGDVTYITSENSDPQNPDTTYLFSFEFDLSETGYIDCSITISNSSDVIVFGNLGLSSSFYDPLHQIGISDSNFINSPTTTSYNNSLTMTSLELLTNSYIVDPGKYESPPESPVTDTLSENILKIFPLLKGLFVHNVNSNAVDKELYSILTTGSEGSISEMIHRDGDSYLSFTHEEASSFGLPTTTTKWSQLPYESFFIASSRYGVADEISISLDNIIIKNNDPEMSVYFGTTEDLALDFDKLIVLAMVSTRNIDSEGDSFKHKLFIQYNNFYGSWPTEKYPALYTNAAYNEGFYASDSSGKVTYNINSDSGLLKDFIYLQQDSEVAIQKESYVRFYFMLPYVDSQTDWFAFGTTVHFWGPPARDTLIAKITTEGEIEDVLIIPFEVLVDDKAGTDDQILKQDYYNTLYANKDMFSERFEVLDGEQLLIIQHSIGEDVEYTDNCFQLKCEDFWHSDTCGDVIFLINKSYSNIDSLPANIINNVSNNEIIAAFTSVFSGEYITQIIDFKNLPEDHENNDLLITFNQSDNYYTPMTSYIPITLTNSVYDSLIPEIIFNGDHWIPNTDEMSDTFSVNISKKNMSTQEIVPSNDDEIFFSLPKDPYWVDSTTASNIYENMGSGFEIYAIFDDQNVPNVRLDIFYINSNKDTADQHSYSRSLVLSEIPLTTEQGKLTYVNDAGIKTQNFGIKAIQTTIRPGDDLQLSFKMYTKVSSVNTERPTIKGTVPHEDFFAVSNKMLLDEAETYLNTNISWTSRGTGDESTAMAYSLGAKDSIANFNIDMNEQRNSIQWYYSDNNPLWTEDNLNPHPEWALWENTTAPGGDWNNYLDCDDSEDGIALGNGLYPRKPNFNDNAGDPYYSTRAAGIDCNGFVQRAAMGHYSLPEIFQNDMGWPQGPESCPTILSDYLFPFSTKVNVVDRETDPSYSLLVPGDILVWDNPNPGSDHIAIVHTVESSIRTTGTINAGNVYERVTLIEATYGDYKKVINVQFWEDIRLGGARTYQLGRLIP